MAQVTPRWQSSLRRTAIPSCRSAGLYGHAHTGHRQQGRGGLGLHPRHLWRGVQTERETRLHTLPFPRRIRGPRNRVVKVIQKITLKDINETIK